MGDAVSKAPRRTWKSSPVISTRSISKHNTHSTSVMCQGKWEHIPEQDVVFRRVGTSVNP